MQSILLYKMLDINNWKTQIKKGYLELCILGFIGKHTRLYGFELLELLEKTGLSVKEGTIYPLLNRMTVDGLLSSVWETQNPTGHPRKFYSLTKEGKKSLEEMQEEFGKMMDVYKKMRSEK